MSCPYQPSHGAASRFFLPGRGGGEERKKTPPAHTYLSISLLRHDGRLMVEKQEEEGQINLSFVTDIIGYED